MKRRAVVTLGIALLAALIVSPSPTPARADGIIIIDPPIMPPEPWPMRDVSLTIKYHRVDVTIDNNVATTRIDQVFINDHDFLAEGTYIFPVPEDAAISDFVMWVNGEPVRGEILEANEARQIYEDYVRQIIDPALLEYVGRGAIKASIFPIQPGEERRIEIEYSEILPADQGLVHYTYPLNTEKFSAEPLEDVSVHVSVVSNDPISSIYSPSHPVATNRDGEYRFEVGYEERDVTPDTDFELYYSHTSDAIGMSLLTYKESAGDDGFFMLLVSPTVEVDPDDIVEKDVILVLDTSGSMHGERLDQAKEALSYVLDNLNRGDRFNVITFSTGTRVFDTELLSVSGSRNIDDALDFVDDLEALGGTDVNRALEEAMILADSQRPTTVILLSDGLATEGEIETEQILRNVEREAPDNVQLFTWGVGDDVDTVLLDRLAQDHGGASAYVREGQRVDEEVAAFYNKISTPVLSDIELDFSGDMVVEDFYPDRLPDLFAGTQLTLVGRYRGDGPSTLTLRGEVNGERQVYEYGDLTFRRRAGGEDFIPRLWATRKIGHLLNQIRLHGEDEELVESVIKLSVRYGIITEYTSFLIDEDDIFTDAGRTQMGQSFAAEEEEAAEVVTGADAVDRAAAESALGAAEAPAALPTMMPMPDTRGEAGGGGGIVQPDQVVSLVGDKTFVLRDGVWVDTAYDPTVYTPVQVGFLSDDYFELVDTNPRLGDYFALGQRVIVVHGDQAIQVVEGEAPPVNVEDLAQPDDEVEEEEVVAGNGGNGSPTRGGDLPQNSGGGGLGGICAPGLIVPMVGLVGLVPLLRKRR
jgi:Ca-activated chloride channel family protein